MPEITIPRLPDESARAYAARVDGDAPGVQPGEGGSTPTAALQTNPESHE